MKALIQFDGGCQPNPGNKYGSHAITLGDVFSIERRRFPLGFGTNNEAEFESLLCALTDLKHACGKAGVSPITITVEILTDSTIVRGWIQNYQKFNPKKCKNERRIAMWMCAGKCMAELELFKAFTIAWNSRDRNVEIFGH